MSRTKTTMIKRITKKLFRDNPKVFTIDFNKNKKLVEKLLDVPSNKLRNIIAGYLVRLVKQQKN